MNDHGHYRLWSIPGDGVLARQGNLVLLISIEDRGFGESLLDLLTRTSEAGGDGRVFADAIGGAVERHQSWGGSQAGPSIVAFGPAGSGLAFTVSGTAFVEISTPHGKHRLVAGHPSMLLRSVVAVPVQTVRGGLGGNGPGDRTDRFTRLDSGTVRAWGLSYAAPPDPANVTPPAGEPHQVPRAPAAPPGRRARPAQEAPPSRGAPLAQEPPQARGPAAPPAASPPAAPPPPAQAAPPDWIPGPPAARPRPAQAAPPDWIPARPTPAAEPPGTAGTGPDMADSPFGPSFDIEPPFLAEPFQNEPPPAAGPYADGPQADGPAPFAPHPAEPPRRRPAPGTPPPFAAEPGVRAHPEHDYGEPAPGRPGGAGPDQGTAAPYDPGLEEPGVAAPPPAPQTSLGPAARPAAEPPPAQHYSGAQAEENSGATIVLGVHCKNGHFTDPDARSCVVCGTGIRRRSAVAERGPRPPLGVLILDDGATVAVDGDYVVGRDPARDESVSAGEARPLRVVDAESTVSRIHAEIRLEGWQVLLADLGSANGTRIQQPGTKAEQLLDPRVPVPIQPGARIFVGASCLRYERTGG